LQPSMKYPEPSFMGGKGHNERYGMFCGVSMQKSWAEMFQIEVLLNTGDFSRVIELGTGTGGTTLMLSLQGLVRNIAVYSYDIGSPHEAQAMSSYTRAHIRRVGALYHECDVFKNEEDISKIIALEGRTLLYNDCGGGKDDGKRKASLVFGKALKKGDVMLVHDYNTKEFHGDDVDLVKKECGLENYEQEWLDKFDAKHGAFIKT